MINENKPSLLDLIKKTIENYDEKYPYFDEKGNRHKLDSSTFGILQLILISNKWGCIIPGPDQENDTIYGMLIGKDKFMKLIYDYLPENFGEILKNKILEKKEIINYDSNEGNN